MVSFSMLMIFIIVTFFERIDSLYEHNKPLSLFLKFIWSKIPEFINIILPIASLTATLLCLGLLTKFNEITAMKTCGISLYRIILPVVAAVVVISVFSFYLQENVLPYSNRKAEEIWSLINDVSPRSYNRLDRRWVMSRDRGRIYNYGYFDPEESAFSRISIYDLNSRSWGVRNRIYADKGFLKENNLTLSDYWERDFAEGGVGIFAQNHEKTLTINENMDFFLKAWKEPDQMSYRELRDYIDNIEESGFDAVKFKVDLNYKLSFPLASLVMALLGIPFAFTMGKRGALFGLGLSVVIAMMYWVAIGFFKNLGYINYLNVFLAAWGPILLFGLVGIYRLFMLKT
jgi:LPS export ABC transporter permease LptG